MKFLTPFALTLSAAICGAICGAMTNCATKPAVPPAPPPAWLSNLEAAYPNAAYIAQRGYGATPQEAQTAALTEISKVFYTRIETAATETITVNAQGQSASAIDSQTFVATEMEIFAARYTDPWFDAGQNLFVLAAYIDRAEAWAMYEPKLKQKADTFSNLFAQARVETDPLKQAFLCAGAEARARGDDLEKSLSFAEILYPLGAGEYGEARKNLAAIPALTAAAKAASPTRVECAVDFEGAAERAVRAALASFGLPVQTGGGGGAKYVCRVVVEPNERVSDAGVFYTPGVTVSITGSAGVVFSRALTLGKVGASDPAAAKRRAWAAVARELQSLFSGDFFQGNE